MRKVRESKMKAEEFIKSSIDKYSQTSDERYIKAAADIMKRNRLGGDPQDKNSFSYIIGKIGFDNKLKSIALASGHPMFIYNYGKYIEQEPKDDTRQGVINSGNLEYVSNYAQYVDKVSRNDTYDAIKGSRWEDGYVSSLGYPTNSQIQETIKRWKMLI